MSNEADRENQVLVPKLVIATRIHLGKQSTPPPQSKLVSNLSTFLRTASTIQASHAVIAVDPEKKIDGYDLVSSIQQALEEAKALVLPNSNSNSSDNEKQPDCSIIQVSPWGSFTPALNALTSWACRNTDSSVIMFISAETAITRESVIELSQHMVESDTLVVGAALPGHDYRGCEDHDGSDGVVVELNGRTCPWNTLAMWNLHKLALLGFPLVGDGVHKLEDGSLVAGGVEEFATVLMHQMLSAGGSGEEEEGSSKAKLVKVSGVEWEQNFDDEERRKWHETKMKSKYTRAEVHRTLLGGKKGKVIHL